jgi:hypothetical protein
VRLWSLRTETITGRIVLRAVTYTVSGLLAFLNIYEFIYLNSIIIFKMVYDSYDFELVTDFQRFYELVYEIIFSR